MADLYDVLNLSRSASQEEVKNAYHTLTRLHHPDKSSSGSSAAFLALNRAYKILSDPTLRAFYDKYGHAGVSLAQDIDVSLVPADRQFEELERKVRALVRTNDEMKLARFARVTAETQFGLKLLRTHPLLLRSSFTSLQQSITFDAGTTAVALATTCHIQRSGGGVSRLSILLSRTLNPMTSLRLACHFTGGLRPNLSFQTERLIDEHNSASHILTVDEKNDISSAFRWTHRFNAWLQGTLGLTVGGRDPSVSVGLSHKKLKVKSKLEVSEQGAEISVKAKIDVSEDLKYSIGPSLSVTHGAAVELTATQTVEPFVDEMEGAFPTSVAWNLVLPYPLRNFTISAKISRGGIGFVLPLEVMVPEDSQVELALVALTVWGVLPFAGLAVKNLWRRLATQSQSPAEKHESGFDTTTNESLKRFSQDRRAAESSICGLVILEAMFLPDGPVLTDFFMARVTNSSLALSAAPKNLLFGEDVKDKRLRIKFLYGDRQYERIFESKDPVMLP
jgi:hypothetical protein